MTCLVGKEAIDFQASAVLPDNTIDTITLKDFKGKKIVLFFYPLDFTFVCPTEILAINKAISAFNERDITLLLISVDSQYSHLAYKRTPINQGGIGEVQITMVSDIRKEIAESYNVLCDGNVAFRATVIINEDFKIRHIGINDLPIGRNVNEILRLVDAIDYADKHGEVCPEGWIKQDKGMEPTFKGVMDYLKDKFTK